MGGGAAAASTIIIIIISAPASLIHHYAATGFHCFSEDNNTVPGRWANFRQSCFSVDVELGAPLSAKISPVGIVGG